MELPGGKNSSFHHYINRIPPHRVYVELFLGTGAVLRRKRAAQINVGVEKDTSVLEEFGWCEFDKCAAKPEDRLIFNEDALVFLNGWQFHQDDFVFADPPYPFKTRSSSRRLYQHEFGTEQQHYELLTRLKSLPCPVMLCGYASDLYFDMLPDWHTFTYQAMTRGGSMATEYIWMNYPPPHQLHDYRYLGDDYREREVHAKRIRTLKKRWKRWSPLERNAYKAALLEAGYL